MFLNHALVVLAAAEIIGGEEFVHRETDAAEKRAGVIIGAAGALLVRQAVIIGGNE